MSSDLLGETVNLTISGVEKSVTITSISADTIRRHNDGTASVRGVEIWLNGTDSLSLSQEEYKELRDNVVKE